MYKIPKKLKIVVMNKYLKDLLKKSIKKLKIEN